MTRVARLEHARSQVAFVARAGPHVAAGPEVAALAVDDHRRREHEPADAGPRERCDQLTGAEHVRAGHSPARRRDPRPCPPSRPDGSRRRRPRGAHPEHAASVTSARTSSTPSGIDGGDACTSDESESRTRTPHPAASAAATMREPMNPAPPVTSRRLIAALHARAPRRRPRCRSAHVRNSRRARMPRSARSRRSVAAAPRARRAKTISAVTASSAVLAAVDVGDDAERDHVDARARRRAPLRDSRVMLTRSMPAARLMRDSARVENRGPWMTRTVAPSTSSGHASSANRRARELGWPRIRSARTCVGMALEACPELVDGATVLVIQGPRFSTRAESEINCSAGIDLVNMTLYPEAALAAELGHRHGRALRRHRRRQRRARRGGRDRGDGLRPSRRGPAATDLGDRRIAASVPLDYSPRQLIDGPAVAEVLAMDAR